MKDRHTILDLLNKISRDHQNISWKIKCAYSDGMGTTINEIKLLRKSRKKGIGRLLYRVETGKSII